MVETHLMLPREKEIELLMNHVEAGNCIFIFGFGLSLYIFGFGFLVLDKINIILKFPMVYGI